MRSAHPGIAAQGTGIACRGVSTKRSFSIAEAPFDATEPLGVAIVFYSLPGAPALNLNLSR